MKILNFFFAVLFLLFAFVQFNDPDPLLWILIYGVMAVIAVLAMFKIYLRPVIILLLVLYSAYSMVYINGVTEWLAQDNKADLFDDVAKMEHLYIEETREFLGLFICILVLFFYLIRSRKSAA